MTTPPPPNPAAPRRGGAGWLRAHRVEAIGGAVAVVAAIALYMRSRSSSAAANSAAGTTDSTTSPQGTYYDSSGDYNSLEAQIAALQNQLAQQTTSTTGQPLPSPTPVPVPSPTPHPPPPKPAQRPPPAAGVTIPSVTGMYATPALAVIRARGFRATTNPLRNSKYRYRVTGTDPSGRAPKGSQVTLNVERA